MTPPKTEASLTLSFTAKGQKRAPDFYSAPEFGRLRPIEREALVLLWLSADTELSGFVRDAAVKLSARLRVTAGKARSALAALMHAGFVEIDDEIDLVLLVGHVETQLGNAPRANPKWLTATARAVDRLPQTSMVRRFRRRHDLPEGPQPWVSDRPPIAYPVAYAVAESIPRSIRRAGTGAIAPSAPPEPGGAGAALTADALAEALPPIDSAADTEPALVLTLRQVAHGGR